MGSGSKHSLDLIFEALNSSRTGLAVCDSNGIICNIDTFFCSFLHQTPETLIGKSISLVLDFNQSDSEKAFSACKLLDEEGTGREKEQGLSIYIRKLCSSGSLMQLLALRFPENKETFADRERPVLEKLLLLLPDLLFTINRKGVISKYFKTSNGVFAVEPSGIVGLNIFDLLSSEDKIIIKDAIDLCLQNTEQTTAEYTLQVDDKIRHYEVRFVVYDIEEVLCVIRDNTSSYQIGESKKSRLRTLELLVTITGQLISTPCELTDQMLTDVLGLIGRELNSSALLLYQFDNENFSLSRSVEWLSDGIQPNPDKHRHLPVSLFDEWMPSLCAGTSLSFLLDPIMPSVHPSRLLAENYNLSALEVIPLSNGEKCHGFFVFLYKHSIPSGKYGRMHLIRLFADLIRSFLVRQHQQKDVDAHRKRLAIQNEELSRLNDLFQMQNESVGKANEQMREARDMAEASDRLKSNFLNMVTHEIRTPLNGIIGFAQLMSMSDITEKEKKEYLQILNGSTDRLINTVNNLLQVSLVMSGNTTPQQVTFDLNEFFRVLRQYTLSLLEQKSIAVYMTVPEESKRLSIKTDQKLLRQAFDQLISNAVKYTLGGFIEVGYTADEDYLRMWVKDTGIGISEHAHKTVFGAFNQESNTMNRSFEGLGLGLSVAKGLIEVLGGQIELISKKNAGSTFSVIFPIEVLKPCTIAVGTTLTGPFPVVVIGDADTDSYASLRLFLMNSGIETVIASTSGGFFRLCRKHRPHIMGLVHTRISGMPFNKIVDTFHNLYPDSLFFAVDEDDSDRLITESGEYQISGFLTKPIATFYIKSLLERSIARGKNQRSG